jgi:hypothetical protein
MIKKFIDKNKTKLLATSFAISYNWILFQHMAKGSIIPL